MPIYFLDTYTLIEITKQNPRCEKFSSIKESVSGGLNLMELYYISSREFGKETAERDYGLFAPIKINYSEETMKGAMQLRLKLRKEKKLKLSYADAIGYQLSREYKLTFVTGDSAFKELEGVEFIGE